MKQLIIFTFITLLFASCAPKKSGTKSSFNLKLGNIIGIQMNGGAYVQTEDLSTGAKNIIKMDADNSATIPNGTYNLLFVTFTGPTLHLGTQYCGSVNNIALLLPSASMTVTINQSLCTQANLIELIQKIVGSNNLWDSAVFGSSKWSP